MKNLTRLLVAALAMSLAFFGFLGTAYGQPPTTPGSGTTTTVGSITAEPSGPTPGSGTAILAEIQAAADAAEAAAQAAAASSSTDEVLGTSVTSSDQLAFTGGSVNAPLALGSIMIGAGGLLLLAARKREQS